MKKLILITGCALLAACGGQEATTLAADNDVAATDANTAIVPAAMSLNETSWNFTRDGKQFQESIDASGNYIANSGGAHADHGTYAMVDGKHCFTSAMTDEGQVCWTASANTAVGESAEVSSDKGEQMTVTRQEYVALTMPS